MCNRLSFSWPMATALMPFTCTICTVGLIIHRRGERSRGLFSLSVFSVSHLIHLSVSFFSYCKGAHSLILQYFVYLPITHTNVYAMTRFLLV